MKTFSGHLTELKSNEIFVFGSNTEGRHGKGAALTALKYFGAKYGAFDGLQGQSYAIVTKNLRLGKRSVPLEDIQKQIDRFLEFAKYNPDLKFYVTAIGSSLGGYDPEEIAALFAYRETPPNIIMNSVYARLIKELRHGRG